VSDDLNPIVRYAIVPQDAKSVLISMEKDNGCSTIPARDVYDEESPQHPGTQENGARFRRGDDTGFSAVNVR